MPGVPPALPKVPLRRDSPRTIGLARTVGRLTPRLQVTAYLADIYRRCFNRSNRQTFSKVRSAIASAIFWPLFFGLIPGPWLAKAKIELEVK